MTGEKTPEMFSPKPPIVDAIDAKFLEAYERQMAGEGLIYVYSGLGGNSEAIGLNPKNYGAAGDNVRFILSGGSLDFGGFSISDGTGDMKYAIYKITLPPENKRPIQDLFSQEVQLTAFYLVSDDGRIINGPLQLTADETDALTNSITACELAPELPAWAQESPS